MRVLNEVTLVMIDCYNYGLAVTSLKRSMDKVKFGAVKFLTDIDIEVEGAEVVKIPRINSVQEYSKFVIKELYKYIDTTHVLIIQHDSGIIYPEAWDDDFLNYSAIGAAWIYIDGRNNSNGGFSLRTKKFLTDIAHDELIQVYHPEDEVLFRLYRLHLEKQYGAIFPTDETCDKFAYELRTPVHKTFGWHGYFHPPFKEHIVLRRPAALGDLIMLEPVICHYAEQGIQVVIDTYKEFMQVFNRYRHKVIHIDDMDKRIKPIKMISFEMVYENNPKQLTLKSFIDVTGEEITLRNSILNFPVEGNGYLFQKYILIHVDETGLSHRNCHGVNWQMVVNYYTRIGYLVFQTGRRMKEQVANFINLPNIEMLMYMISGASLLIGIDSSPAQMAVALGTPAVIFFGSVDSKKRYINFDKIEVIHSDCSSGKDRFCYHEEQGSTTGKKCEFNEDMPPCSLYSEWEVIRAANKLLKLN